MVGMAWGPLPVWAAILGPRAVSKAETKQVTSVMPLTASIWQH